jgi:uncharacterized protein
LDFDDDGPLLKFALYLGITHLVLFFQILKDPAPYPMIYLPSNVGYWEESSAETLTTESLDKLLQESRGVYVDQGATAYRRHFLGQVRNNFNKYWYHDSNLIA